METTNTKLTAEETLLRLNKCLLKGYDIRSGSEEHGMIQAALAVASAPAGEMTAEGAKVLSINFLRHILDNWHLNPHEKETLWRTRDQLDRLGGIIPVCSGITTERVFDLFVQDMASQKKGQES